MLEPDWLAHASVVLVDRHMFTGSSSTAALTSKLGNTMAMRTAIAVTSSRKSVFNKRVRDLDWLNLFGLRRAARGSTDENTSSVDTIGAALPLGSASSQSHAQRTEILTIAEIWL